MGSIEEKHRDVSLTESSAIEIYAKDHAYITNQVAVDFAVWISRYYTSYATNVFYRNGWGTDKENITSFSASDLYKIYIFYNK